MPGHHTTATKTSTGAAQSDGEERPTDHVTTPALKRLTHTSETGFCLQEEVWQYLGKDRDVHLDLGLCMCVYKHMCKKSSKQRLEI